MKNFKEYRQPLELDNLDEGKIRYTALVAERKISSILKSMKNQDIDKKMLSIGKMIHALSASLVYEFKQ